MAQGDIPATGGINDIIALLGTLSGQSGNTAQRTTGTQTQNQNQNTIQNLLSQMTGSTQQQTSQAQTNAQTTAGSNRSTQTTRSDITAEGINRMLQTTLEADNGIASIFSGQASAGGYGSTTSGMLASDLIARTAGELARLQAGTTVTTEGTQGQTVTGLQQTTGSQTQTQNQTTQQNNTTNVTGNTTTDSTQQMNQDRRVDAQFDPGQVLAGLIGGTVLGPSIGTVARGLGNIGQDLAGLLRGLFGSGSGGNTGEIMGPPAPGDDIMGPPVFLQNDFDWLRDLMSGSGGMFDGIQSGDVGF